MRSPFKKYWAIQSFTEHFKKINFDSLLWKVKLFIFCGDNTTVRNPADFLSVSRDHRTGRGSSGIRSTFFDTLVRSIFDVVESVMIAIK